MRPNSHAVRGVYVSPTARSLKLLRALGYTCDVVERANKWVKHDYIGIGDIIAFNELETLMVQATTMDHLANREKKARENQDLVRWVNPISPGRRFELHGWALRGKAGTRKRWTCTRREL